MFGKWQERHRGAATLDGREHERVNRQGFLVEVQQSVMSEIRSLHVITHRPKGIGGFNIQDTQLDLQGSYVAPSYEPAETSR